LSRIFLNENEITDEGVKALAGATQHIKKLKQIGLNKNRITDVGLRALVDVADHLKHL
jgi:hypothetical protein